MDDITIIGTMKTSQTGKIISWKRGERDLLAPTHNGKIGGAHLHLTHRGIEHLGEDRGPFLQRRHNNQNAFAANVTPLAVPTVAWSYGLYMEYALSGDLLTYTVEINRTANCDNPVPMPAAFGIMLNFATLGNFAQLSRNGTEIASSDERYDNDLVPMSAFTKQDITGVDTMHGHFNLIGTGCDGIVVNTMRPDRCFGVMLTAGAFEPVELLPGQHTIMNVMVKYQPKGR